MIEDASRDLGLEFTADVRDRRFVEFGSGSRLVTYKLYRRGAPSGERLRGSSFRR